LRRPSAGQADLPRGDRPDTELAGLNDADRRTIERAIAFTMTGPMRLRALVSAVRYCIDAGIPGAFAECGVWRGGSVLAMLSTLQAVGVDDRDIYLYDTFEGMTEPTEADVSPVAPPALDTWREAEAEGSERPWGEVFGSDVFDEASVRELLLGTGYPPDRLHFVRGRVEDTIPGEAPERLALLRLDTDWYESTRHEMHHLYPRLATGGVLIIDDYGHWEGARRAVDEYLEETGTKLLLTPVDYTARVAVKP
jgi:hypothetical protein